MAADPIDAAGCLGNAHSNHAVVKGDGLPGLMNVDAWAGRRTCGMDAGGNNNRCNSDFQAACVEEVGSQREKANIGLAMITYKGNK
jgi:hypothetical protein